MIIKSFKAKTASNAMNQIRREMGEDAIVLKTQQLQDQVEITACIENATVSKADGILNSKSELNTIEDIIPEIKVENNRLENNHQVNPIMTAVSKEESTLSENTIRESTNNNLSLYAINEKLNKLLSLNLHCDDNHFYSDILKPYVALMQRADLPNDFIYEFFLSRSEKITGKKDAIGYIVSQLTKILSSCSTPDLKIRKGEGVLFYGPAGSGKSSLLGKLAVMLVAKKKNKVKLASLDDQKIGAFEELAVYADLLQLDTVNANSDEEQYNKDYITLIDTPAFPENEEQQNIFSETINQIQPEYRIAVFSALTRTDDVLEISEKLSKLNPTHLAVTMLDLTNRLGGIIAATRVLNTKLLFVADAPGGVKQIMTPDPHKLAKAIMGMEVSYE